MARQPEIIANEIQLLRQVHEGSFLVLEDRAQRLLYERFLAPGRCRAHVVGDKATVQNVVSILKARRISGVLGVIDRDLDALLGTNLVNENLIYGDCNDVESMLIKSTAFEKVIGELGSLEKIQSLEQRAGCPAREILLRAALPVGYLRLTSQELGLSLRFRDLDFARFVNPVTLEVDNGELVRRLKDHSQRPELDSSELLVATESRASRGHDPWDVCNGHDLVQVMSLGLRRALGSQSAIRVTPDIVGQDLRIAYERHDFEQSEFCRRAREWETRNHPYRILP